MIRYTLFFFLFLNLPAGIGRTYEPVLSHHLNSQTAQKIWKLMDHRPKALAEAEAKYQRWVTPQIMSDLALLYDPANEPLLKITYASFTPELDGFPGKDLGYGMHVVKRLVLQVAPGIYKVIEVNEAWPENRDNHGLLAPDEIRVKTRVFNGVDRVKGSENRYLFDRLRLAWGPGNDEVEFFRQPLYERQGGSVHRNVRRVPISSPFSCLKCHGSRSPLAKHFLSEGETRNFEAIVQDSHYELPVEKQTGFRDYLAYLSEKNVAVAFRNRVVKVLANPLVATRVPGLFTRLQNRCEGSCISNLPGDPLVGNANIFQLSYFAWPVRRQGFYLDSENHLRVDALEEVTPEGKYRWWEPSNLIP